MPSSPQISIRVTPEMRSAIKELVDEGWFLRQSDAIREAVRRVIRDPDAWSNHRPHPMVTGNVTGGPRIQARTTAKLNAELDALLDAGYAFNRSQLVRSAIYSLLVEYRQHGLDRDDG